MLTERELRQLTIALFHSSSPMYPGPKSNINLDVVLGLLVEYSESPDFAYHIEYDTPHEGMTRQSLSMGKHGQPLDTEVPGLPPLPQIPPPPEGSDDKG